MAEEFQLGSGNWWETSTRNSSSTATAAAPSTSSATTTNNTFVGWPTDVVVAARSSMVDDSTVCVSGHESGAGGLLAQSGGTCLQIMDLSLSSQTMDWNPALFRGDKGESSFRSMLQEEATSGNFQQHHQQQQQEQQWNRHKLLYSLPPNNSEDSSTTNNISSRAAAAAGGGGISLDNSHFGSSNTFHHHLDSSSSSSSASSSATTTAFGGGTNNSSPNHHLLQGLLSVPPPADHHQQQHPAMNYSAYQISSSSSNYGGINNSSTVVDHHHHQLMAAPSNSWSNHNNNLPQFLRNSPPKHPQPLQHHGHGQLHFSNNTPFWNASSSAPMNDVRSNLFPSLHSQIPLPNFEDKSKNTSEVREVSVAKKSSSNETSNKRPRNESPTPMPAFKVRKEKMGDRITALQQLVSPFGKTDTASVLSEAIEYIKFLHEQVGVLSTPYMKSGAPMTHLQVRYMFSCFFFFF
ncbi:OLC1v1023007C1 [Oldenlandia corymbosa var. corymbosa]|uniref:OLC1v1023007C1 n=1 Tax=Oldenlandia corymbosa var. corymbosa TaxID=529605 RepID=A0AAV1BZ55_OLDCO|nr:OLC1v1023007C1 [Oldenlandia corymbosa var. corymbosa]